MWEAGYGRCTLGTSVLEFNYPLPKAEQQFTAEEPVHIQRVPVYLAAK